MWEMVGVPTSETEMASSLACVEVLITSILKNK
jgi:hypothetical protein